MRILVASHTYIVPLNCEKLRMITTLGPDVEVTVVVPRRWRPGGVQNRQVISEPWEDGRFRVIPLANFSQNNQGLLCFGAELISLLRTVRPHILQAEQGSKSVGYAQLITLNRLLKLQAKNVFFTWWNLPYSLRFPLSALEAHNLRHTHGLIAGNQDGADILQKRGYGGQICVMPQLGVDEQIFAPQPQPELAAQLGLSPQDFVVGFVGRFVEEKGLLTLCDALTGLGEGVGSPARSMYRPWKWLLVGRGPLRQRIQEKADLGGIGDRLIWVESVPHADVPRYINLMHTLVLPSQTTAEFKTLTATGWKEQFGHVLIEAMACQVPVVGSDSGEIPHVIGDAGLVFPEGDAAALRHCLHQLMTEPETLAALGQAGHTRAMTNYTNRALAQQQLAFYQKLLD